MSEQFDPYHIWLGIAPKDQPPNHYRLLGIDLFESNPDVIISAAYQRMAHVKSFATGKNSVISQQILNELASAKVCLLTPQKKAAYDRELHRAVQPPMPPSIDVPATPVLPTAEAIAGWTDFGNALCKKPEKKKSQFWVSVVTVVGFLSAVTVAIVAYLASRSETYTEVKPKTEVVAEKQSKAPATATPRSEPPLRQPKHEPAPEPSSMPGSRQSKIASTPQSKAMSDGLPKFSQP